MMKNIWQILTLLLAVALVVMSVKNTLLEGGEGSRVVVESLDREQVVLDNIMTRSSVRSYTSQPVEIDKVETLLRAGMAAPTAGNRQPWELVVITNREILDAIPPVIPGAHMAAKAQLAIAVCGYPSKALVPEYWVQDCSAVTENILLAAHGMGLGAVWCGAYPDNAKGRVAVMQEMLGLPEELIALSIIVIGYPDTEPHVKEKWDPSKVKYLK